MFYFNEGGEVMKRKTVPDAGIAVASGIVFRIWRIDGVIWKCQHNDKNGKRLRTRITACLEEVILLLRKESVGTVLVSEEDAEVLYSAMDAPTVPFED